MEEATGGEGPVQGLHGRIPETPRSEGASQAVPARLLPPSQAAEARALKDRQLASVIERRKAGTQGYPPDWHLIATRVKALAGWCCERCHVRNNEEEPDGTMLTVHHLTGEKWNCEPWNLAALCQRCHLRVQSRVVFYRIPMMYDWVRMAYEPLTVHSRWMARHIRGYNVWALLNDRPLIPLVKVVEKDYSKEWSK